MKRLLALTMVVSLTGSPVWAQNVTSAKPQIPRVAVVEFSIPQKEAPHRKVLRSAVAGSFSKVSRVQLVRDDDVASWVRRNQKEEAPLSPSEELAEGRELLSRGKAAYESLQMEKALKLLEGARREFILHLPALRSNRDLLDAHLYVGMTYVALKKKDKAKEEFRRVVYLDPSRELSSRDYSPAVIEVFAKARQEAMAANEVQVQVDSQPTGAKIYLNGRFLGTTPHKTKLHAGEYFLLAEKDGMEPWYQPMKLQKRIEHVRISLAPLAVGAAVGDLFRIREGMSQQSDDVDKIRSLASAVHADMVFLGALTKSKNYRFLGQLFDARTDEFSQVAVVAMGDDLSEFPGAAEDLVHTLTGFIRPDGYLMTSSMGQPSIPEATLTVGGADRPKEEVVSMSPVPEKEWYRRWWIWPIVVVAGASVYLGATQLGSSEGSKLVIDNRGNF